METVTSRISAKDVRRALPLSAVATLAVMIFKSRIDPCWFRYNTWDYMAFDALMVLVFSFFWFVGSWKGRFSLVAIAVGLLMLWTGPRFFLLPSDPEDRSGIEKNMAESMRRFQQSVIRDKAAHPEASYETLIQNEELTTFYPYCTRTTLSRTSAVGPATGFVMFATPDPAQCSLTSDIDLPRPATSGKIIREIGITRECGPRRSFAISTDGKLHSTTEPREANLNDPVI